MENPFKKAFNYLLLINLLFSGISNAQDFQWATKISSSGTVNPRYFEVDNDQNVYSAGIFIGSLTYDINGVDSTIITGYGVTNYIQKIDALGDREWLYTLGGGNNVSLTAITSDSENNLFAAGSFKDSIDFDPSDSSQILIPPFISTFIQKFDPDGNLVWVKQMDQLGSPFSYQGDRIVDIKTDSENNIIILGTLVGTVDMDPGEDTLLLYNHIPTGFVQKLNPDGELLWAQEIIDTSHFYARELEIDEQDNLYIRAEYTFHYDYNLYDSTITIPGESHLLLKMDPNGTMLWANGWERDEINAKQLEIHDVNNIYLGGLYKRSTDFDPSENVYEMGHALDTILSNEDMIFLLKLNAQGEFQWAIDYGANGIIPSYNNKLIELDIDPYGNIYTFNVSDGFVNFDPSNDTVNNGEDPWNKTTYINILDSDGSYLSTILYPESARGNTMTVDHMSHIYTIGEIIGEIDLDFGPSEFVLYNTDYKSVFTHKMGNIGELSIHENSTPINTKLYPNPSHNYIHILFEKASSGTLHLIDIKGQIISSVDLNDSELAYQFDISSFPSGIYFVELIRKGEKIDSKKFIKR